jgi:hypothetical protein
MIPLGYVAKRIPAERPDWLHAPSVVDVYSVSDCVNYTLLESNYTPDSPHICYGMFDSPAAIASAARSNNIDVEGTKLFFYEAHESEFDGHDWLPLAADNSHRIRIMLPSAKDLVGFDVVTSIDGPNSHSPLSCNGVAAEVRTNQHCLFETFNDATAALSSGAFEGAEEGPYRIYAVYSVAWPE